MVKKINMPLVVTAVAVTVGAPVYAAGGESAAALALKPWSVLPFAGILLSLAVIPLFAGEWWEHNFPKVAAFWGVPVGIWLLTYEPVWVMHTVLEYIGFIALLGSLFVISGGIYVKGRLQGTPLLNVTFLAIGAVLANLIGTTGASMILVRPLIRANSNRLHKVHIVVFLIFLVSNVGGCLTPLGDPPLFLGLLRGVPFFWTMQLFPEWLVMTIGLLGIFYLVDLHYFHNKEEQTEKVPNEKIVIDGKINFAFLTGVLGAVLLYSFLPKGLGYWREAIQVGIMLTMAALSYRITPAIVHQENEFKWHPIKEVAILFAAIFICMIPALEILHYRGKAFGVTEPWQFFWATGILSSFLDNAPTYLTFMSLGISISEGGSNLLHLFGGPIAPEILRAVSLGAVFMGANTYIGNGPNFMVKSIAEHSGIKMPSFFGYMAWSVTILFPLFFVITFIFMR